MLKGILLFIFTYFKISYVFLILYIDMYNLTSYPEKEQVNLGTSDVNSTKIRKEAKRFWMTPLRFLPKDECFDTPLSAVHRQSPLLFCDFKLPSTEPSCNTLLSYFLFSALFVFAYFVSQAISDARRLFTGSYVGILAATALTWIIIKVFRFDFVCQDSWYLHPVLVHFTALISSFWTMVFLRADLIGCLDRLARDITFKDFALLPSTEMSALVYPCLCTLCSLVFMPFLKRLLTNNVLECVGLCWLADSSLYISLHMLILMFDVFSLVMFLITAAKYHSSRHRNDKTVRTVFTAFFYHFITFLVLSNLWYLGAWFTLLGHKTLWHLIVSFAAMMVVGWLIKNFYGKGLTSIFMSPFTFEVKNLTNAYFSHN